MANSAARNSHEKLPKIKIFLTIQKNLSTIGIIEKHPINANIFLNLLTLGAATIFELFYIFLEAKTFFQYVQSIYMCSTYIIISLCLMILILNLNLSFEMINGCECIANTSKRNEKSKYFYWNVVKLLNSLHFNISELKYSSSQAIFKETNQLVEKISEFIFLFMAKMTPAALTLPPLIYSFFIYFTTDLGRDAFILPSPMWWAYMQLDMISFNELITKFTSIA